MNTDEARAIEAKIDWMVRTITIRTAIMWGIAGFIIWLFGLY